MMYHKRLLFEFDVAFADKDFGHFQTDIFVGVADAIHLVSDELAQLFHVAGIGTQVEKVEYRT